MEFTTGGRLVVRITPEDQGKRVSVRHLARSGERGEKFTDTVGVLTSWDAGVLSIVRRNGETVHVPEHEMVAGKVIPAEPARRRGPAATFRELALVSARAWQPVESEALGEWTLRAAGGFTRRANSVLPLGDPGMPLEDALAYAHAWYTARDLPTYVQTSTGAEGTQESLCVDLEKFGWVREVSAQLRIAALAPIGDLDADVSRVELSRSVGSAWLGRYQRTGTPGAPALKVLESGPSTWFATVAGDGGAAPAAIGRCVVDGRWAGFMAVEVDPAQRRRGLATAVMTALARRALSEGASAAWLQVEADNEGARALYDAQGFATHHTYHHFRHG